MEDNHERLREVISGAVEFSETWSVEKSISTQRLHLWQNRVFFIVGTALAWIDFSKGIVSTHLPPDALVDQLSIGFYENSLTLVHNSKKQYYSINLDENSRFEPTVCDRYVSFNYVNIRHIPQNGSSWFIASHHGRDSEVHHFDPKGEHPTQRLSGETSEFLCVSEAYAVLASQNSTTPNQDTITFVSIHMNGKLGEFSVPPAGTRPRDAAFFTSNNDSCAAIISGGKLFFGTIHQPGSKVTFKGPFASPVKWNAYNCLSSCGNSPFLLLVSQSAMKTTEQTITVMDLEQPDDSTGSFAVIGTFPIDTRSLGPILKIRAKVEEVSANSGSPQTTISVFALTGKGLMRFTLEK